MRLFVCLIGCLSAQLVGCLFDQLLVRLCGSLLGWLSVWSCVCFSFRLLFICTFVFCLLVRLVDCLVICVYV